MEENICAEDREYLVHVIGDLRQPLLHLLHVLAVFLKLRIGNSLAPRRVPNAHQEPLNDDTCADTACPHAPHLDVTDSSTYAHRQRNLSNVTPRC